MTKDMLQRSWQNSANAGILATRQGVFLAPV